MIKFKEMKKRVKKHIIIMWICGIGLIILSFCTENIWTLLIGLIFLTEIVDTYIHEDDKKTIEEYEEILDKYYELVGMQNREIWKLRKEVKDKE